MALLLISCKKEPISQEDYEIGKAIELTKSNADFNDMLAKFRKELGVDFMLCYTYVKNKHRVLGFQILQSDTDHAGPLRIDRPFKIETFQGIDIFFCTVSDDNKKFQPVIDDKTKRLIARGYLTTSGRISLHESKSVSLVYCKDDDNNFKILPSEFLYKKEMEAHNNDKNFHEEDYYPDCD